jgi:hypothetical protein
MKKLFLLPLFAFLALFVSCSSSDGDNMPDRYEEVFYGKLLKDGAIYNDDTKCELNVIADMASITIYNVGFLDGKDVTLSNLSYVKSGNNYEIKGTNIIAIVGGEADASKIFRTVSASLNNGKFQVTADNEDMTIGFSNALQTPVKPADGKKSYNGNLLVGDFEKEVTIDVIIDRSASLVDVVMKDVKFAPNMPLVLDITVKEMLYTEEGGVVAFAATDIDPYMNTEQSPSDKYRFSEIVGEIKGGSMVLSAKMADNLAPFVAGKEFAFSGTEVVE